MRRYLLNWDVSGLRQGLSCASADPSTDTVLAAAGTVALCHEMPRARLAIDRPGSSKRTNDGQGLFGVDACPEDRELVRSFKNRNSMVSAVHVLINDSHTKR